MPANRWLQLLEENPGHSTWYIERFRTMAAEASMSVVDQRHMAS